MKKRLPAIFALLLLVLLTPSFKLNHKTPPERYRPYLIQEIEFTIQELNLIRLNTRNRVTMQKHYHLARQHYKHIEVFVEASSPQVAKNSINGPLVFKYEPEYGNKIIKPQGFQVIEEMLFDAPDRLIIKELEVEVNNLIIELNKLEIEYGELAFKEEEMLEMLQYELYRIASLNLGGYDATFTSTEVMETIWCLDGMEVLIKTFHPLSKTSADSKKIYHRFLTLLHEARQWLNKEKKQPILHRLEFIRQHILPLNATLVQFHNAINLPWGTHTKALQLNQKYLFGPESFNLRFFSADNSDTLQIDLKKQIGEKLFFDPLLSGNEKKSCASCHHPDKYFTDGLSTSIGFSNQETLQRNAPTLINVAFQQAFFYDGRVYELEQQAIHVIHNPKELNADLAQICKKLALHPNYRKMFSKAFGTTQDTAITPHAILVCLAEFQRSLISFNSRFDQYLRGNDQCMNAREINGYNLFSGKALCGSCHFFPLFNGTVPPYFNDTEFEVLGTPFDASNQKLDTDLGRYEVTKNKIHQSGFKTPTLRNIEFTAPYMHNGVYKTLDEVIEFYHRGGGAGLGFEVPNQTLPFDSLLLTPTEKEDIILFLKTLTDTTSYGSF